MFHLKQNLTYSVAAKVMIVHLELGRFINGSTFFAESPLLRFTRQLYLLKLSLFPVPKLVASPVSEA